MYGFPLVDVVVRWVPKTGPGAGVLVLGCSWRSYYGVFGTVGWGMRDECERMLLFLSGGQWGAVVLESLKA